MIDLRDIPGVIINLPSETIRRQHIEEHFSGLGLNYRFVDGDDKHRKKRAVCVAQSRAFDTMISVPFWVGEDDIELRWDDCILPHIPDDADIIYLATTHAGCCPHPEPVSNRVPVVCGAHFALAERHDDVYLRLLSMISAMAVLVLTERGRARYRLEQQKGFRRNQAVDVRYAMAMPDLNVYALRQPMFAERADIQIASKKNDARREVTQNPMPVAVEGETRTAVSGQYAMEVRADRNGDSGKLEWTVLRYRKQPNWPGGPRLTLEELDRAAEQADFIT